MALQRHKFCSHVPAVLSALTVAAMMACPAYGQSCVTNCMQLSNDCETLHSLGCSGEVKTTCGQANDALSAMCQAECNGRPSDSLVSRWHGLVANFALQAKSGCLNNNRASHPPPVEHPPSPPPKAEQKTDSSVCAHENEKLFLICHQAFGAEGSFVLHTFKKVGSYLKIRRCDYDGQNCRRNGIPIAEIYAEFDSYSEGDVRVSTIDFRCKSEPCVTYAGEGEMGRRFVLGCNQDEQDHSERMADRLRFIRECITPDITIGRRSPAR